MTLKGFFSLLSMIEYFRLVRQFALALFGLLLLTLVALSLPTFTTGTLLATVAAACLSVRARQERQNKHAQHSRSNDHVMVISEPTSTIPSHHEPGLSLQSIYVQVPMALFREKELWLEKRWWIAMAGRNRAQ